MPFFITNNYVSFTCGEKENLIKHQKVSKYFQKNLSHRIYILSQSKVFFSLKDKLP